MSNLLSTQGAARQLGVSPRRIRQWLAEGRLAGDKISGVWVIPAEEVARQRERLLFQQALRVMGISPRNWGRIPQGADDIMQFECPRCGGPAFEVPPGLPKYDGWAGCSNPDCGWVERQE
ncbi:MAG TPA: DNA-binding protein [Anaerolineae bacterium]|nr:DNA-binding protein [Anaerolineae bacterium]